MLKVAHMKKQYWEILSAIMIIGGFFNVSANKSIYHPSEKVTITVSLGDESKKNQGSYQYVVTHLGKVIEEQTNTWQTTNGHGELTIEWDPPQIDFQGYLVQIKVSNEDGSQLYIRTKLLMFLAHGRNFQDMGI